MQPAARISAAIEILADIENSICTDGPPADRCVAAYMKQRRYIGSKDRRAISALVYGVLRRRGRLSWITQRAGVETTARALLIAYMAMCKPDELHHFGAEGAYAPADLSVNDVALVELAKSIDQMDAFDDAPCSAKCELPNVVEQDFIERFGDGLATAMAALNQEAPLGLRINPIKADFEFINDFRNSYQNIETNQYSPIGFSSRTNIPLQNIDAYRDGRIEVQDQAAQLASYLADPHPGMTVVDLCAGAGGKSLLVAALMENRGEIQACDIGDNRLKNLKKRAARAGVSVIQTHLLPKTGVARTKKMSAFTGRADRVLVDAPCSGTGTWRRNPDQRWRLTRDQIDAYTKTQLELLKEGAELVTEDGRLIYMTCSLLPLENECVVDRFIEAGGWKLRGWKAVWEKVLPQSPLPLSLSQHKDCLQLAPHVHGTDGFFTAIFERT